MNISSLRKSTNSKGGASFIPREKANFIPFSLSKFDDILALFSLDSDSVSAAAMKQTMRKYEEPGMKGEEKQCDTPLESMVEFSMEKFRTRDVIAVLTTVDKESGKQEYIIRSLNEVESMKGKRMVAYHAEAYAYAVFYCHAVKKTRGYRMRMEGEVVMEAGAVCHMDRAGWNKEHLHLAFKVLKVKPGSVPFCHFLPEDHVVWGPIEDVE